MERAEPHHTLRRSIVVLAIVTIAGILGALAACETAHADTPKTTVPSPSERFEHDMIVRYHMHGNFGLLRAIELELVHDKLADGQLLARMIVNTPDELGLEPFAKEAAVVRARAAEVASAPSTDEALRGTARLADACAECHAKAGVLPEFTSTQHAPADAPTVAARMARHRWATERLWEGVVGRSDDAWSGGLDVLSATPLPWATVDSDRKNLAKSMQQLADTARKTMATTTPHERARQYGELLVTCAACHR